MFLKQQANNGLLLFYMPNFSFSNENELKKIFKNKGILKKMTKLIKMLFSVNKGVLKCEKLN